MGLESYNFKVKRKKESLVIDIKNSLTQLGYVTQRLSIFTKRVPSGVIEMELGETISIRTAVPNHPNIIDEIFFDLTNLNNLGELSVYDYQLRSGVELQYFEIVKEKFKERRTEFLSFYPHISYPISCEETIEQVVLEK